MRSAAGGDVCYLCPMKSAPEATADALAADASRADGRIAGWTAAALFGVMWAGVPWAAPLAAAAPLALELRRGGFQLRTSMVTRWVVAIWVVGVVSIGLMGARAIGTVPFGPAGSEQTLGWLEGGAAAPPGPWSMLAASIGFAVATATTRGLLGSAGLAGIVLWTAVAAGGVYARSHNVFEATAVALPAWTLLWVAGMTMILSPLSASRPWRRPRSAGSPPRALIVGAALVAAAVLLRLALAGPYTELAQRLTMR